MATGSAEESLDPSAVGFATEESFSDDPVRVLVLGIGYRGQESRAAKNHDPGISGNRPKLRVMADQTPDRIPNLRGELEV